MSTAVDIIRLLQDPADTSSVKSSVYDKRRDPTRMFSGPMKYANSVVGLAKMSSGQSLLDVIRSQSHAMLEAQDPTSRTLSQPPSISKSQPIRIVSSDHHHHHHHHGEEECVCTSAELERFYDQATWRMYILIQSARVANDTPAIIGRVPTTAHSHAPFHPQSSNVSHNSSIARWTTHCPSSVDTEEDIFDMEL